MKTAVYPGSFDPITFGHIDVIRRASGIFNRLIIAIAVNESKKYVFSPEERRDMILQSIGDLENVDVEIFQGMTVDFMRSRDAQVILRGIRTVKDFEYEFSMALANRHLARDIETVFLMPDQRYSFFSSRLAKEVSALGGPVEEFVPEHIASALRERLQKD